MPGGDGTGPWWAQDRNFRCLRRSGFGRGFGFRNWQASPNYEPMDLSKDEEIKILTQGISELEKEKQELEKKLKELQS